MTWSNKHFATSSSFLNRGCGYGFVGCRSTVIWKSSSADFNSKPSDCLSPSFNQPVSLVSSITHHNKTMDMTCLGALSCSCRRKMFPFSREGRVRQNVGLPVSEVNHSLINSTRRFQPPSAGGGPPPQTHHMLKRTNTLHYL